MNYYHTEDECGRCVVLIMFSDLTFVSIIGPMSLLRFHGPLQYEMLLRNV